MSEEERVRNKDKETTIENPEVTEKETEGHEDEQRGEESLESKIIALEREKEESKDKYLRTLAEFENYRRRTSQERVNWIRNANETLILKLCDVLDDFERAIQNQIGDEDTDNKHQGLLAIFRKLQSVLKSEGATKIETEEMEFDPMYHDAITYAPSDAKKDTIVAVIQNGYIMNNKVIRPAKVVLSSGEGEQTEETSFNDSREEDKYNNQEENK